MVIVHQNLTFFPNNVVVSWRVLDDRRCSHCQLVARQSCDLNSNRMMLVNKTKQDTITLEPEVMSNFTHFSLTVYDEQGITSVKNSSWNHFNLVQEVSSIRLLYR